MHMKLKDNLLKSSKLTVKLSMRMLFVCLSPRPRMWPTMELTATDLV